MKANITNYTQFCILCGTPSTDVHHCIPGNAKRRLADEDGLTISLCRDCHDFIHRNGKAATMSKIIGQLAFEKEYSAVSEERQTEAREVFRKRYGGSYL